MIGPPPSSPLFPYPPLFRSLPAGLVADVAGRRADQPGHRVLLGVLAHVDADHGPLVVEQELRQRLGQLGLAHTRSEEHTSELQSRQYLVCRLLLEKKKKI